MKTIVVLCMYVLSINDLSVALTRDCTNHNSSTENSTDRENACRRCYLFAVSNSDLFFGRPCPCLDGVITCMPCSRQCFLLWIILTCDREIWPGDLDHRTRLRVSEDKRSCQISGWNVNYWVGKIELHTDTHTHTHTHTQPTDSYTGRQQTLNTHM